LLSAATVPTDVLPLLKDHGLDWWTPILVGYHFRLEGSGGAHDNPEGWMSVMEALMQAVDHNGYRWRRWVDSYDFLRNAERFDRALTVNSVSVAGDVITYDLETAEPIRFLTLRAERTGYRVASVLINGATYAYFGENYVHLPEITGNVSIQVTLTPGSDWLPHCTYIEPSGVIEDAHLAEGKLQLTLSGEFVVTAEIRGSSKVFRPGRTRVYSDETSDLKIDLSSQAYAEQVDMAVSPASDWVDVTTDIWDAADTRYRRWTQAAASPAISVEHTIGALLPNTSYTISINGGAVDTCLADGNGAIVFSLCPSCSAGTFEVIGDSTAFAGISGADNPEADETAADFPFASRPNPFQSETEIFYCLGYPSHVEIAIYSVTGSCVRKLVDELQPAGAHSARWDGLTSSGESAAPGVYFCTLCTAGYRDAHRVVFIR
jgi:hypothetical protein